MFEGNVQILSLACLHSLKNLTIHYYFAKEYIITNICNENNEDFFPLKMILN